MSTACVRLSSPDTRDSWEIPVLYEDQDLLALDKPALLLSSPDRYDPARPNLMRLLHRDIERGAAWVKERQITYLANVHRLDFETSGVFLLAKNKPALVELANQFGSEKPVKIYVALCHGRPLQQSFQVEKKLLPNPARLGQMKISDKLGKKSTTLFTVRELYRGFTLMGCQPLTGRTHQIRVHLRFSRLPIVGDVLYGGRPLLLSQLKRDYQMKRGQVERPLIARTALHAEELRVKHPTTGQEIAVRSEWPKDLRVAVKYLRQFAGEC